MARPSKYKPEYTELAGNLALLGLTDAEMAGFFGVVESTLNKWKLDYPEFSESLKEGKEPADGKVARKLYTEALAGNVTAMIFWLKNRQPTRWRDRVPEGMGELDTPIGRIEIVTVDGRKQKD